MIERLLAGIALAGAIASAAWRLRSLTPSGAVAATIVGAAATAAGWSWAALLILFFVSSTALSRLRADAKERRVSAIVEKGGERDAAQVLANGGVFAACAVAFTFGPDPVWRVAALGALAAASADTWGTEIGTLAAGAPRSIVSGQRLDPGTSGGVTAVGTAAEVAGAAFLALGAALLGWPGMALAGLAGGVAGAIGDSLLGATVQERRWCRRCEAATERRVHPCGTPTRIAGGIAGFRNDGVNFASGLIGALVAVLVSR